MSNYRKVVESLPLRAEITLDEILVDWIGKDVRLIHPQRRANAIYPELRFSMTDGRHLFVGSPTLSAEQILGWAVKNLAAESVLISN